MTEEEALAAYNSQVSELAAIVVTAAVAIQQSESSPSFRYQQLVNLVLSAIMEARSIGCWWANVRYDGRVYEPQLISPAKHKQVEAGLTTVLDSDNSGMLVTLARNETVRAAADQFTATATELFLAELDEMLADDDEPDETTDEANIVWELVNDADPCPRCVAVKGQLFQESDDFQGVHINCGCFLAPTYRKVDR